jgi:hypothetical protein
MQRIWFLISALVIIVVAAPVVATLGWRQEHFSAPSNCDLGTTSIKGNLRVNGANRACGGCTLSQPNNVPTLTCFCKTGPNNTCAATPVKYTLTSQ